MDERTLEAVMSAALRKIHQLSDAPPYDYGKFVRIRIIARQALAAAEAGRRQIEEVA